MRYSLLAMIFAICCWSPAQGAEVKKLLKKSKKVVISEGTNSGFDKGKEVCVMKDDEQLVCAEIYKAKKKKSYIKIKKRKIFKKIEKGMPIVSKESLDSAAEMTADSSGKARGATNLKLGYVLSPITPSVYNAIYYADPDNSSVNTLWMADRTSSISLAGFAAEVGFGVWRSKLNIGFRSRSYKPFVIKANYTNDGNQFAETNLSASSIGAWLDFNYLIFDFGTLIIDFGNGIDVDISDLSMNTSAKNDEGTQDLLLYEASSNVSTISLRTNLNFNFYFDPVGIQLGTSFLIPISASSPSSEITVSDTQVSNLSDIAPEDDVIQAIGHRKSSFGLEMFFSTYYAF